MFDFNCDVAQSFGPYKISTNSSEYEIAAYASSINISAGFHAGDPVAIRQAFLYAKEHNRALAAHIGYPDMQGFGRRKMILEKEELEAVIIYQVSAILAYAGTFDLAIESVRCHGALKDELNSNRESALVIAESIKKISPWLNLIVQNQNTKDFIQSEGLKAALEYDFKQTDSIDEIIDMQKTTGIKFDTIHFKSLEDIKKAYETIKPTPVNYNRVQGQI